MPGATGDGRNENLIGKMGGSGSALASSVRATAIAYALPTMYGFNGAIAYTGSSSNGNNENTATSQILKQALSLNLGWSGYGVDVKGAFQQAKIGGATTAATAANPWGLSQTSASGYTSYLIGAAYTGVPGLKLAALYNRNTVGTNTAVTAVNTAGQPTDGSDANKGSNNQYWLGASYRFGNNEPRISWAQTSNTNFNGGNANDGGRQITANWGYYLSKRTQVYGIVSSIKNNQDATWYMASQGTGLVPTAGQSLITYGAGMRTNF
jgi:predicted porin